MAPSATRDARRGAMIDLAARQGGLIGTAQLERLGFARSTIAGFLDRHVLIGIHRGVHAVGVPRQTLDTRCWAAILACHAAVAVSHRTAAALLGLLAERDGPINVTVLGDLHVVGPPGVRVHRAGAARGRVLRPGHAPPRTDEVWTLRDLAATGARPGELREAVRRAIVRRRVEPHRIRRSTRDGRPGDRPLREALDAVDAPGLTLTRDELEPRLLILCHQRGLAPPEVGPEVCGYEVDFLWRAERVVVETDGHEVHGRRDRAAADRRRDRRLATDGYAVVRVGYDDMRTPAGRRTVLDELHDLLVARSRRAGAAARWIGTT